MGAARVAQRPEKVGRSRNRAGRALERLDQDRSEAVRILPDQALRLFRLVVPGNQEGKGHGDRRRVPAEVDGTAVVAALEHHDRILAGYRAGGDQRHQVGLGAGGGEAYPLDGRKSRTEQFGKPRFAGGCRAKGHPAVQRLDHRRADRRMRVAVEAGGEVADEIGVGMAVDIGQRGAGRGLDREREGRIEHAGARVAAGQARLRAFVVRPAGGIGGLVARRHRVDRALQIGVPAACPGICHRAILRRRTSGGR